MNTKFVFISLLVTFFWLLIAPASVSAANLTVSCDGSDCLTSPTSPSILFNETNWLPGDSVTQTVTVDNSENPDPCNLTFDTSNEVQTPSDFASQLNTSIDFGATNYFNSSLNNLFGLGPVSLGTVPAGAIQAYDWSVAFSPAAGNQYQLASTVFDFDMIFACGLPPSPTPTPTPTSSPSSDGGGGTTLGAVSTPVCNATVPTSAPTLTITAIGTNTVSLSWTPVSPVTHYGLTFTRNSDGATYGSPNVGNVTSYTVSNLSGAAGYTFQVFAVNDCAPGPLSNSVSSGQVPGPLLLTGPTGPGGEILGIEEPTPTSPGVLGAASQSTQGQVAGETTCNTWRSYLPWYLLLLQIVIILVLELFMPAAKTGLIRYLLTTALTIMGIIIFYILRQCDCDANVILGFLCRWYWLVALVLLATEEGIFHVLTSYIAPSGPKFKSPKK